MASCRATLLGTALLGGPGRASKATSTAQPGASWGLLVTGQANAGLGCPQRAERDQEEDPWAESQRQIRPRPRREVKNAGLGGAVAPAAGAAGCDEALKGDEAGPGHPGPRRPGQAVSRRVLQGLAAGRVCSCLALPLEAILSQSVLEGHRVEGLPFGVSLSSWLGLQRGSGRAPHKNKQKPLCGGRGVCHGLRSALYV